MNRSLSQTFSTQFIDFITDVVDTGGMPLLVGGWVRDKLLGIHSKDKDVEVYNLPLKTLKKIARNHGRLYTVGAAFAVLKLTLADGDTVDVSLPRREVQTGKGHRGFEIHADPEMSIPEAAQRRDLTVNAISMHPLTGEIIDPTNGCRDLENRILRHVGPRFREDPLRVLRVYQFQARLGFDIACETRKICQVIADAGELATLPRERIEEELRKICLRSQGQHILPALRNAREDHVIKALFPELQRLAAVEQDTRYHAEGDALEHTFRAIANAADISRRQQLDETDTWTLCLAAMIHDLGKAEVSQKHSDGTITSYGHDKAGQPVGEQLLQRITGQVKVTQHALALARVHMRPLMLAQAEKVTDGAIRRLAQAVKPSSIEMLCLLTEADTRASIRGDGTEPINAHDFVRQRARNIGVENAPPKPVLQGRHLMELARTGQIPDRYTKGGPHFKPILDKIYSAQLDGRVKTIDDAVLMIKSMKI